MLLRGGGIELLCDLTRSPYEPLALNSLWALKNLTFRGDDSLKSSVMSVLGWATLRRWATRDCHTFVRLITG